MADVELPRYRLKARSFMSLMPDTGQKLLEAGTEITYLGLPNENLIPVNHPAEKMYDAAGIKANSLRPELSLPLHGPGGGEAGALQRQALGFDEMTEQRFIALERQVLDLTSAIAAINRAHAPAPTPVPAPPAPPPAKPAGVPPPPPPPPPAKHGKGA